MQGRLQIDQLELHIKKKIDMITDANNNISSKYMYSKVYLDFYT